MNTPTYDLTILAEPNATHYWEMNDKPTGCGAGVTATTYCTPGPCPSTMADSISSGATAVPSPVPLVVTTPTASPYPQCGVPGMLKDGETAAYLDNANGHQGQAFIIPSGIIGTLCNGNAGGACNTPFSIECIVAPAYTSTNNAFFDGDAGTNGNFLLYFNSSTFVYEHGSSNTPINGTIAGNVTEDVVFAYSGVSGSTGQLYLNGVNYFSNLTAPTVAANVQGYFGLFNNSANFVGRIEKCSTYNVALTPVQVWTHYLTSALP